MQLLADFTTKYDGLENKICILGESEKERKGENAVQKRWLSQIEHRKFTFHVKVIINFVARCAVSLLIKNHQKSDVPTENEFDDFISL